MDTDVTLSSEQLGRGVSGTVVKGTYRGQPAAIKVRPSGPGSGCAHACSYPACCLIANMLLPVHALFPCFPRTRCPCARLIM